jgi:pyruvate dehydrogenase E2 component (dihydrolipoamide acetyltransferase)
MPTQILMPALSPTMEEGTLTKWLVKEGDAVKAGDVIAEIETDKANMEVEAVDEGVVGKIIVPAGTENVKVNAPIAVLLGEGEDKSALAKAPSGNGSQPQSARSPSPPPAAQKGPVQKGEGVVAQQKQAPQQPAAQPAPPKTPVPSGEGKAAGNGRVFASPLARRMASEAGVELATVPGSGPHGRIVKSDIETALKGGVRPQAKREEGKAPPRPEAPPPSSPLPGTLPDARLYFKETDYDFVPHDSIRKTIAKRLTVAKRDIPHFYLNVDCEIDALLRLRKELNDKSPKDGEGSYKLSVNDFVIRAAALALMKIPGVNASWTDTGLLKHHHADIGVAVALDFGLITPIVFKAEGKGLAQISNEVKILAERARAKKLKPQEFEGGTFAVSNLGMYGIKDFTAVINPPHAAILAVGMGEERPIVKAGALAKATVMSVRLSCDHRVVDGALGAKWLQVFKAYVEDPVTMLL